jgi:hypothetical protein
MKSVVLKIAILLAVAFGGLVVYRTVQANRVLRENTTHLAALDRDFSRLSQCIIDGQYQAAYDMADDTIKTEADSKTFAGVWEQLIKNNGPLRKIEGRRRAFTTSEPTVERAVIDAEFFYPSGVLQVELVFGRHHGKWWLQGYQFPALRKAP